MKKIISVILIIMTMTVMPKSSSAFLAKAIEEAYNVIPISPVINFGEDITETGKMINKTYAQVQSLTTQIKKDSTSIKSSISSLFPSNGLNFLLNNITSGKNTLMCGSVLGDINIAKMSKKMKEVLLTYSSSQPKDLVKERLKSFYMDNIYNIYAALQVMKYEMDEVNGAVGSKIASLDICVRASAGGDLSKCVSGDYSGESEEGKNESIAKYGYVLSALEDLLKMWERVAALKAQMKALEVIKSLEIMPKNKKSEQAFLNNNSILQSSYSIGYSEPLGFAQMVYKSSEKNLDKVEEASEDAKQNSPKSRFTGAGFVFTSPEPSADESPMTKNSEKMEAFNNLAEVEDAVSETIDIHNSIKDVDSYRTTAQQYKDMKEKYRKKLSILNESNQCGRGYISRYFTSVDQTWSGVALDANNVNNYDLRKGISGWAFNAYEVAKGAETTVNENENGEISYSDNSSVQADDMETETLEDDDTSDVNKGADLEEADSKVQQNKDSYNNGEGVSASTSEKTQEENRKAKILAWQIGAEASKALGADAAAWGNPTNRKMIWNDTKYFYNQYLREKYKNIKNYLQNRYKQADVVDVFISLLNGAADQLDISQTEYQTQLREKYAAANTAIQALLTQSDEGNTLVNPDLLQQKASLKAQIDELSAEIKKTSDEVSDINDNSEENSFEAADKASSKDVNFLDDSTPKQELQDNNQIFSDLSAKTATNKSSSNLGELKGKLGSAKIQRDILQNRLKEINQQIEADKANKQSERNSVVSPVRQGINAIVAGFSSEVGSLAQQYIGDVDSRFDTALANISESVDAVTLKGLIQTAADEVINEIMGSVESIVNDAYSSMIALGEDLYLPSSSSQVASIHQDMIDRLKALTITKSVAGYSLSNMLVFSDLATLDVSPETEGFFVGALPRERDLKSPYPMTDLSQPPVREVFHFDMTDYSNVKAYSASYYNAYLQNKRRLKNPLADHDAAKAAMLKLRGISRGDFLNYGGEIPAIWQLMLQDNAFIEKQYDLSSALNQGCEAAAFLRGGIMPCRVGDSGIVLDVNVIKEEDDDENIIYTYDNDDDQYVKRTDLDVQSLPKCLLIDIKKNKPYHTFHDDYVNTYSNIFGNDKEPAEVNCPYSELGILLEADGNNNLFIKSTVYEVFNDSFRIEDTGSDDLSRDQKNQLAIAQQAELSRNQIGDFLRQAESEKKMKLTLDEMKQKYDEQINELKKLLSNYGYTLQDNYDITKDDDYNLTINKLKQAKNKSLQKASNLLQKVEVNNDNQPALTKKNSIDKLLEILQKDKEADLELSMSSAEENNLDEEFRRVKADKNATEKYNKKVKEENKGEFKDLEEAYCANY